MMPPKKNPAIRTAERAVERRRDEHEKAAHTYEQAHAAGGETRSLLSDLRDAVRDLRAARETLATLTQKAALDVTSAAMNRAPALTADPPAPDAE